MNFLKKISLIWKKQEKKKDFKREFEWCIVGNIVDEHYWGEKKEIRKGSKHFRPGAKVYCIPQFGGTADEFMPVLGKPRKKSHFICVIIKSKLIVNLRLQKVYDKRVKEIIQENPFYRNNKYSKNELRELNEMVIYLKTLTEEIN